MERCVGAKMWRVRGYFTWNKVMKTRINSDFPYMRLVTYAAVSKMSYVT